MKSLTVFDPEKVFTEVIKPKPYCLAIGGSNFYPKLPTLSGCGKGVGNTHVFSHTDIMPVP